MATVSEYIKKVHLNSSKLLHLINSLPKYNLLKILLSQTMGMPSQATSNIFNPVI